MTEPTLQILDHGYIRLVETWGSDEQIIESARQSTDGAFRGWGPDELGNPGDEKLLRYLYTNKHSTPFEMAGATIEVQAPIFVFREWHRHRTQSYNELSARYTPLPDLYYVPTVERCMLNSKTNKQAGRADGAAELTGDAALAFAETLALLYRSTEEFYQAALSMGVPKEVARCIMPVGHYSRMRASANLRNWLGFMTLRQDAGAQWEIRQYADVLNGLLVDKFPRTMALFNEEKS